jgi:hypothetical protein
MLEVAVEEFKTLDHQVQAVQGAVALLLEVAQVLQEQQTLEVVEEDHEMQIHLFKMVELVVLELF